MRSISRTQDVFHIVDICANIINTNQFTYYFFSYVCIVMTQKQKENIAKIFTNVGSIIFAGVVLRYFIPGENIGIRELLFGSLFVVICFVSTC